MMSDESRWQAGRQQARSPPLTLRLTGADTQVTGQHSKLFPLLEEKLSRLELGHNTLTTTNKH